MSIMSNYYIDETCDLGDERPCVVRGYFVQWVSTEFQDQSYVSQTFRTRELAEGYARMLTRAERVQIRMAV